MNTSSGNPQAHHGRTQQLAVSEVFGPTIQGEGPLTGRRAGFVRLGGCNLACSWCDTPYTWDYTRYNLHDEIGQLSLDNIVATFDAMDVNLCVITGGEPLLQQQALVPLIYELRAHGVQCQIETNGTIVPSLGIQEYLWAVPSLALRIVASPKLRNSGNLEHNRVNPLALGVLKALGVDFKFVITSLENLKEVDAIVHAYDIPKHLVWIMPEGITPAHIHYELRAWSDEIIAKGYNVSGRMHISIWGNTRGR